MDLNGSLLYFFVRVTQIKKLFNSHVDATLEFKRKKCEDPVPVPELNSVQSLCKLIEVLCIPENGVEFTGDIDMFSNICRIWFIFWYIIYYIYSRGKYTKYEIYKKKGKKNSLIYSFHSLVWSICATVNEESRFRVDNFIREIEGTFPLRDTVYEYFVDSRLRMFVSWEERLPSIWKIPAE